MHAQAQPESPAAHPSRLTPAKRAKATDDCCAPRLENLKPAVRLGSRAVGSSHLQLPKLHTAAERKKVATPESSDGCHYTLYTLEAWQSERSPSLSAPILEAMAIASQSLSKYSPSFGSSAFKPLRSRIPRTNSCTLLPRCQQ